MFSSSSSLVSVDGVRVFAVVVVVVVERARLCCVSGKGCACWLYDFVN